MEVDRLAKEIKKHKILYYRGNPEISDQEFDNLEEQLRKLDANHPVLKFVGVDPRGAQKIKHETKMLSLSKTYEATDLKKWIGKEDVVSTLKIDGVSCSLIFQNEQLLLAKTRGNGTFGEDITNKVQWIDSIPKRVNIGDTFEVRGELYCDKKSFDILANEMQELGLDRPSSPRNIVAGLLSRKDYIDLCRFINFKSFELITNSIQMEQEIEKFKLMKSLDFDVADYTLHKDHSKIEKMIETAKSHMDKGDYQIDGLVFAYNELKLHKKLGETSHHPRYKMAFKFAGNSKVTTLNDIEWNVSRNGVLTPVGIIEPLELSGAMISRVTLHNYGVVRDNKLKPGDRIEIIRSGEVIPKFLSVVESLGGSYVVPTSCPSCQQAVLEVDIRLICDNKNCPSKKREEILHFVQKIGIEDLSTRRLEEMIEKGILKEIPDLYSISKEQLLSLDKVKDKLAEKLFSSIKKTKEVELVTFLSSLGLSGGAINKCEKIVQAGHDSIDKILDLNVDKLTKIESFAEKSAQELIQSLSNKRSIIQGLIKKGVRIKPSAKIVSGEALKNLKFCITGTLSRKRSDVEKQIKSNGGQTVSSVTGNTDYLVTNDVESSSSKFKKAQELNIPILSEEKLDNLIASNK